MSGWTPVIVFYRLVEAYRVIEVVTSPARPAGYGRSLPAVRLDPQERYTGRHLDEIERQLKAESERRAIIAAEPISMALEAQRWPIDHVDHPEHREILIAFATCRAFAGDWSAYVQRRNRRNPAKKAWIRQKTYGKKDKALQSITTKLNNSSVLLRNSERCPAGHEVPKNAGETDSIGSRAWMAPDGKPRGPRELGNPVIYAIPKPRKRKARRRRSQHQ